MHPLLYRRQFLLGPRSIGALPEAWRRVPVAGGRTLHAHPDLPVVQRARGGLELTLLGYAIDPHHPERDDADVLDALLAPSARAADVPLATEPLGGRWALVAADADGAFLVHDASGYRQVVHARVDGDVWAASQPLLLGRAVSLAPDPEAAEFVASDFYRRSAEAWWPGDRTRYAGVRALLPNHVLDLGSGEARRFWPAAPLVERQVEDGAERGCALLRGMVAGAHRRFPLAVALTAGIDSRTTLAAARGVAGDLPFFTHLHYDLDERHVDVVVARKLARRLGLRHRVIDCVRPEAFATSDDPDVAAYRDLYLANASTAHVGWGGISYTLSREIPADRVCVKSVSNAVTKGVFSWRGRDLPETDGDIGRALAAHFGMDGDAARRAFTDWAADAVPAERYGYSVLDLCHLEQRVGRWQAADQLERDLDHETFDPGNSREYFRTLFGVPVEHRWPPRRLHREMIRRMWPEALRVPINPPPFKTRARTAVREALMATGTLGVAKRIVRLVR